jgi:hypothetical protein
MEDVEKTRFYPLRSLGINKKMTLDFRESFYPVGVQKASNVVKISSIDYESRDFAPSHQAGKVVELLFAFCAFWRDPKICARKSNTLASRMPLRFHG